MGAYLCERIVWIHCTDSVTPEELNVNGTESKLTPMRQTIKTLLKYLSEDWNYLLFGVVALCCFAQAGSTNRVVAKVFCEERCGGVWQYRSRSLTTCLIATGGE